MTVQSDQQKPPACARCAQTLHYLTAIPKRLDQRTGFIIYRCDACGHIQWEPNPRS